MIERVEYTTGSRDDVLNLLKKRKQQDPTYTVIDVGGSVGGWSVPVVDAIVDMNVQQRTTTTPIDFFKINITDPDAWTPVFEHVQTHGKFDYCICTHTLEDICCPVFVASCISKIARAGYMAVPSKYKEFCRFEGPYRGYIHHRWIFDVCDDQVMAYPKLNFLEHWPLARYLEDANPHRADLGVFWKDVLEIHVVNDDYMGPTVQSVLKYYEGLVEE